ncbi:MAG: endolytic transglycosylase MltG, partial [Treponema sp.]|nr:endolytic transglycosylase MltG [Treponema sp.]
MPKALRLIVKLVSVFIALGIIACAVVLGGTLYFNAPPNSPPAPGLATGENPGHEAMRLDESGALILEVRGGESAQSVGRRLASAGIIRHEYFWNLLARLSSEHIRAGTYRIELPASQTHIRSVLTAGEQILVRVTIPEGLT